MPDACIGTRSVVVIPPVRKGLCNQRMRMVQDIVVAKLLGASVVLPKTIFTRQGCHFEAACYTQYTGSAAFAEVYSANDTAKALAAAGVCVLPPSATAEFPMALAGPQLRLPAAASSLHSQRKTIGRLVAGRSWTVADSNSCCTLVIPDAEPAVSLLRRVNAAFAPAPQARSLAREALRLFYERARAERAVPIAVHWRAQSDMAASSHRLNATAYALGAARAILHLADQIRGCPAGCTEPPSVSLLALGGASAEQLASLHRTLTAAFAQSGAVGANVPQLWLHSKEELLPDRDWSGAFAGNDDVVAMVDLELAGVASAFVGSPFSSFSVVAAAVRRHAGPALPTSMVPVDVADRLGAIFALQFPYSREREAAPDPCAALSELHRFRRGPWSCPRLASPSASPEPRERDLQCLGAQLGPSLRIDPPVDAPSRLGFRCTHAVVTALYGGYDALPAYPRAFYLRLRRQEEERLDQSRSCWFAFTDPASVGAALSAAELARAEASATATTEAGQRWVRLGIWHVVIVPSATFSSDEHVDGVVRSRLPKMMAHCVLRHAGRMLYLDAKLMLPRPDHLWAMTAMRGSQVGGTPSWVAPVHPYRSTVRDELVCLHLSGLVSESAFEQLRAYRARGFPDRLGADAGGPGLSEGEWHARDLQSPEAAAIGSAWFAEYHKWSAHNLRDQISFNFVVWSLGLLPSQTGGAKAGFRHFISDAKMAKRAAMSACIADNWRCYIARYADVRKAFGADNARAARRHFNQHGFAEGRNCACGDAAASGRKAAVDFELIQRSTHRHPRNLSAEEAFLARAFGGSAVNLAELRAGHRWCAYPSFAANNMDLIVKLSRLLEA